MAAFLIIALKGHEFSSCAGLCPWQDTTSQGWALTRQACHLCHGSREPRRGSDQQGRPEVSPVLLNTSASIRTSCPRVTACSLCSPVWGRWWCQWPRALLWGEELISQAEGSVGVAVSPGGVVSVSSSLTYGRGIMRSPSPAFCEHSMSHW